MNDGNESSKTLAVVKFNWSTDADIQIMYTYSLSLYLYSRFQNQSVVQIKSIIVLMWEKMRRKEMSIMGYKVEIKFQRRKKTLQFYVTCCSLFVAHMLSFGLDSIQFTTRQWSSITIKIHYSIYNHTHKWKSYDAIEIRFLAWAINWIHNMNIHKKKILNE